MKSWKPEAIILAIGMLIMGYFIKNGLDTSPVKTGSNRQRIG